MNKRIVITGGPGTGKTVLVRRLEQLGYPCFHEIIREMTMEAKKREPAAAHVTNPLAFVSDPQEFNRRILQGRLDQFSAATDLQHPYVFFDRGLPDIIAYMDYFGQPYDGRFTGPCKRHRYDMVVLLPPWKAIYRQDGERMESYEQACEIHHCLAESYRAFGYETFSLPTGTVEERTETLLDLIQTTHG